MLTGPGTSFNPFILTFKVLYTLWVRKKLASGSCPSCDHQGALEDFYCRWRGREAVGLLLQEGQRGASGSKVPWGQAAADSRKWYLDPGGRNERGACVCLPETGSSLSNSAAVFHHPGLPQMWWPACPQSNLSHTMNMLKLCCLPSLWGAMLASLV